MIELSLSIPVITSALVTAVVAWSFISTRIFDANRNKGFTSLDQRESVFDEDLEGNLISEILEEEDDLHQRFQQTDLETGKVVHIDAFTKDQ